MVKRGDIYKAGCLYPIVYGSIYYSFIKQLLFVGFGKQQCVRKMSKHHYLPCQTTSSLAKGFAHGPLSEERGDRERNPWLERGDRERNPWLAKMAKLQHTQTWFAWFLDILDQSPWGMAMCFVYGSQYYWGMVELVPFFVRGRTVCQLILRGGGADIFSK